MQTNSDTQERDQEGNPQGYEQAAQAGETLDQVAMIRKLKVNSTIQKFWFSDIERCMLLSDWYVIVLSNQSLVLRTLFQHTIIVSLCHKPKLCLWLLIAQEALYSLFNLYCKIQYSHLKRSAMMGIKIFQSIFLMLIFGYFVVANQTNDGLK